MADWNLYRKPDGTIDLHHAFTDLYYEPMRREEFEFLQSIMEDQPIRSRQAAAVAINVAAAFRRFDQ